MPLFDSGLAQWGFGGIVAVFVLLMAWGKLVPLSTLRREVAAAEQRAQDWKDSWQLERTAREIQAKKDDEILDLLRSMNAAPRREPAA